MTGSLAVLTAALGAAPINYELSLRTEGRTGTAVVTTNTISTASFLELDPVAVLSTRFGTLSISGGYRPRLLYSLNEDHSFAALHRASLGGSWRISRKTSLTFDESVSIGQNDFSPLLAVQGTTPPDPRLPTVLILDYFSTISTVGITHSTLTGIELGASSSYSISGGLTESARSVIPVSRSETITGNAAFEVTRTDAVTSRAVASVTTFSTGADAAVGNLTVGWRRQLTRATQGDVSAGVNLTVFTQPGAQDAVGAGPSATLGLTHRTTIFQRQQLNGTARASYGAAIDPYGGGTYHRVEGMLGAEYSPMRWLAFSLRGSGARGLSGPPELRNALAQLEFATIFNIDRHLSISGGTRTAWVSTGAASYLPGFQWSAFIGVTVRQDGKL